VCHQNERHKGTLGEQANVHVMGKHRHEQNKKQAARDLGKRARSWKILVHTWSLGNEAEINLSTRSVIQVRQQEHVVCSVSLSCEGNLRFLMEE